MCDRPPIAAVVFALERNCNGVRSCRGTESFEDCTRLDTSDITLGGNRICGWQENVEKWQNKELTLHIKITVSYSANLSVIEYIYINLIDNQILKPYNLVCFARFFFLDLLWSERPAKMGNRGCACDRLIDRGNATGRPYISTSGE